MGDKAGDLMDLFHDVLLTAKLDDKARFRQVCNLCTMRTRGITLFALCNPFTVHF
jgi:hypothetical protein